MATEWFVEKGGKWHGPVSSERLKELAKSGRLNRDDRVCRGRQGKPIQAKRIKGLFSQTPTGDGEAESLPKEDTANNPVLNRVIPTSTETVSDSLAMTPTKKWGLAEYCGVVGVASAAFLVIACCGGLPFMEALRYYETRPSGWYIEDLAAKHDRLYLFPGGAFGAQEFAVGVNNSGLVEGFYWRLTTVFLSFTSWTLDASEPFWKHHLHTRQFSDEFFWEVKIESKPRFTGFVTIPAIKDGIADRWKLSESNLYTSPAIKPKRVRTLPQKLKYNSLKEVAADFDAVYTLEKVTIFDWKNEFEPSKFLRQAVIGIYGTTPTPVIFCDWGNGFERLSSESMKTVLKMNVDNVAYTLDQYRIVNGKISFTLNPRGFEAKKMESDFEIELTDKNKIH